MAMPTFHTMGIYMQLLLPLVSGQYIALYTPKAPEAPVVPNPQNVIEVAKITGCTAVGAVPSFIEVCISSFLSVRIL